MRVKALYQRGPLPATLVEWGLYASHCRYRGSLCLTGTCISSIGLTGDREGVLCFTRRVFEHENVTFMFEMRVVQLCME